MNCRDKDSLDVGLTGTYINPTGGDSADNHEIAVRFDNDEPVGKNFVQRDQSMFLYVSTFVAGLMTEPEVDEALMRVEQIFLKRIADGSRLRMKFPQHGGPVVLDFPLSGAKDAILEVVTGCGIEVATGVVQFLDADEKPYESVADLFSDKTWRARQVAYRAMSVDERGEKEQISKR